MTDQNNELPSELISRRTRYHFDMMTNFQEKSVEKYTHHLEMIDKYMAAVNILKEAGL